MGKLSWVVRNGRSSDVRASGDRGLYLLYRTNHGYSRLYHVPKGQSDNVDNEPIGEASSPAELKRRAQIYDDTGQLPVEQTQDRTKSLVWKQSPHIHSQVARGNRGWYHVTGVPVGGVHRVYLTPHHGANQPVTIFQGRNPQQLMRQVEVFDRTNDSPEDFDQANNPQQAFDQGGIQVKSLRSLYRVKGLSWRKTANRNIHEGVDTSSGQVRYHLARLRNHGIHRLIHLPEQGESHVIDEGREPGELKQRALVFHQTGKLPNEQPPLKSLRVKIKKLNWLPDNRGEFAYSHHGVYGVSPDRENSDVHHLFYMDANNISHAQHMRSGPVADLKRHAALHDLSRTPKGSQNDFQRTHQGQVGNHGLKNLVFEPQMSPRSHVAYTNRGFYYLRGVPKTNKWVLSFRPHGGAGQEGVGIGSRTAMEKRALLHHNELFQREVDAGQIHQPGHQPLPNPLG